MAKNLSSAFGITTGGSTKGGIVAADKRPTPAPEEGGKHWITNGDETIVTPGKVIPSI